MKTISIVTACYNEEDNVRDVHAAVRAVMQKQTGYDYEHIFIDNASEDHTVEILREIAQLDPRVRVIVNTRNFGHIRSPMHAVREAYGDAVVLIVADLQDPPELIADFIKRWEAGYKVAVGIKEQSAESPVMFAVRRLYYRFVTRIAETRLIKNFTGFGLYDKQVIDLLRQIEDPYPYFRGLIADLGFEIAEIPYRQPRRQKGFTKNNFYTLYDMAMLGITSYSRAPLRMAVFAGFGLAVVSFLVSLAFLVLKLIFWQRFEMGTAPLLIGIFFFASVQLFFTGLLGEYVGAINLQVRKRPLVVERERINFPTPKS